jgi:hypothetical protein
MFITLNITLSNGKGLLILARDIGLENCRQLIARLAPFNYCFVEQNLSDVNGIK